MSINSNIRPQKDISTVFNYTIVGVGSQNVTSSPHESATQVTIINDDGVNTNSVLFIGQDSGEALIPVRAGVDITMDLSSTGSLWVKGTAGDIITVIVWR